MLPSYWRIKISKGIKCPYSDEILIGIDHELLPNFKVGLSYQYNKKSNIVDGALLNPDTGKSFYRPDSGYWVSFTPTVPALDIFPAQKITMYFAKADAPSMFLSLMNIPDAYRKYSGLELTVEKRMSNGWQLGGSVDISKSWGNHQGDYVNIHGLAATGNNANWFVNNDGRLNDDKPLVIKIFGVFNLPFGLMASFFYHYYDGSPWGENRDHHSAHGLGNGQ